MLVMEGEIDTTKHLKDKLGNVIKEGHWVDVQGIFEKVGKNEDGTLYFHLYNKKELVSSYSPNDIMILKHQKK
tara:strand:- start:1039 stop:1257 length:219 start_codon:yes stop_codon:yes gene_type:complete